MDLKKLGKTTIELPAIGLGTWEIGGAVSADISHDNEAINAIRRGVELGMYLIDTAEMYAAGHSEELVGKAIRCFPRDKVFIVSKVWHDHLHYNDLIRAAENSLKRLRTDWIDLYLIHWPNPSVPLRESVSAIEELVQRELVRFFGVGNFNVNQMEEVRSYLSKNEIVANEIDYSLLVRGTEKEVIPYCQKHKITVLAYRPLARGKLAQNEFLRNIGKKYHRTAAQVALNWIITKDGIIPIPKAVNLDHLEENAGAMGWRLCQDDIESMSNHFSDYLAEYGLTMDI